MPKSNNVKHLDEGRRGVGYHVYDRDPLLDEVVSYILNSPMSLEGISAKSGVSVTTLHRWINGQTKKPMRITMEFVLRTQGKTLAIVDAQNVVKVMFPKTPRK